MGRLSRRRRRDARGAATLLAVSCLACLLLWGAGLATVGGVFHAHRQAQAAADLAALAGATALGQGEDACGEASAIAAANHASLGSCTVHGREVEVQVSVPAPPWPGLEEELVGRARAGPVSTVP